MEVQALCSLISFIFYHTDRVNVFNLCKTSSTKKASAPKLFELCGSLGFVCNLFCFLLKKYIHNQNIWKMLTKNIQIVMYSCEFKFGNTFLIRNVETSSMFIKTAFFIPELLLNYNRGWWGEGGN